MADKFKSQNKLKNMMATVYVFSVLLAAAILAYALLETDAPSELAYDPTVTLDEETLEVITDLGSRFIPIKRVDKVLPTYEPPWKKYAAVTLVSNDKPRIAIVIDDLGLSRAASIEFSRMDGPLTLSYLPYAKDLAWQTATVRKSGHELLVHMPMEPQNTIKADPGPEALYADLTDIEFDRRLDWNLRRFNSFVGVNNHMGSGLTANGPKMARVIAYLKREGFLFLDSLTTPKSKGHLIADKMGIPYQTRDIFLDNKRNISAINKQMRIVERIADKRGYAIAIGHPYPETIAVLKEWLATRENRGYELVPVSSLMKTSKNLFSSEQVIEMFSGAN